jgi:L-aspartate oxidase
MTNYNCIVVGSGLAGLNCALHSAKFGSVLVISKNRLKDSNSWLAQGGIAAAVGATDDVKKHVHDTLVAGCFHNDKRVVGVILEGAPTVVKELLDVGMPFDRDAGGVLALKREGGHGMNRIVHYRDYTGKKVSETLIKNVRLNKNITVLENAFVTDLLVRGGVCYGVRVIHGNKFKNIFGGNTVLATGGLGQIYSKTTNPFSATGDGIALAYKAGCALKDLEFVQFHPTALNFVSSLNGVGKGVARGFAKGVASPLFLLSETLRGHGAKLLDKNGKRFMVGVHLLAELAPRDILSRVMFAEEKKGPVYLDLRGVKNLRRDFPMIYAKLKSLKINPAKDLIPATAVAHYSCGGVVTDLKGRVNLKGGGDLKGLFAAGEVACTGLHGANRLASNSLLEAAVMGKQVGENLERFLSAKQNSGKIFKDIPDFPLPVLKKQSVAATKSSARIVSKIQDIMWKNVGIVRDLKTLKKTVSEISALIARLPLPTDKSSIRARLLAQTALLVAKAALLRKRSLGCHFIRR